MPTWVPVAKASDVSPGSLKQVYVGSEEILLSNVNGKIAATQGYCGHMNMHLHLGKLTGNVLQCPFHSARFNVQTGEVVQQHEPEIDEELKTMGLQPIPTRPLKTYQVRVGADQTVSVFL